MKRRDHGQKVVSPSGGETNSVELSQKREFRITKGKHIYISSFDYVSPF